MIEETPKLTYADHIPPIFMPAWSPRVKVDGLPITQDFRIIADEEYLFLIRLIEEREK